MARRELREDVGWGPTSVSFFCGFLSLRKRLGLIMPTFSGLEHRALEWFPTGQVEAARAAAQAAVERAEEAQSEREAAGAKAEAAFEARRGAEKSAPRSRAPSQQQCSCVEDRPPGSRRAQESGRCCAWREARL